MSLRDSPLLTEDPLAEKLITSADSLRAASSNEILVLVESSKKRLATVLPVSAGSFFMSLVFTCCISTARLRSSIADSLERSLMLSRCFIAQSPRLAHHLTLKVVR